MPPGDWLRSAETVGSHPRPSPCRLPPRPRRVRIRGPDRSPPRSHWYASKDARHHEPDRVLLRHRQAQLSQSEALERTDDGPSLGRIRSAESREPVPASERSHGDAQAHRRSRERVLVRRQGRGMMSLLPFKSHTGTDNLGSNSRSPWPQSKPCWAPTSRETRQDQPRTRPELGT